MDVDQVGVNEGHIADGAAFVDHLLRGRPWARAVLVGHHLDAGSLPLRSGAQGVTSHFQIKDPWSPWIRPKSGFQMSEGEGCVLCQYRFNKTGIADTYCDHLGPTAGLGH